MGTLKSIMGENFVIPESILGKILSIFDSGLSTLQGVGQSVVPEDDKG